jgi:shikimate kinase/3-dehydroquinate synthase
VRLGLPVDADAEIAAAAAGMSIPEIFAKYGERYFRDGERRVIMRLLNGGPVVLATGGGAFLDPRTRDRIAERGVSVWLDADLKTLLKRVRRKNDRPLLQTEDPEETLRQLLEARRPLYELADLRVESREVPQDAMVDDTLAVLAAGLPMLEDLRQRAQSRGFAKAMTHLYPAHAEAARRQETSGSLGGRPATSSATAAAARWRLYCGNRPSGVRHHHGRECRPTAPSDS